MDSIYATNPRHTQADETAEPSIIQSILSSDLRDGALANTEENVQQEGIALFAGMYLGIRQVHVSKID